MPSVSGESGPGKFSFRDRGARPVGTRIPQIPCVVKIIFRPCAINLRILGAVDVEQIVAFAEPGNLRQYDTKHSADVVADAFGIEKCVIVATAGGSLLPVVGMKVGYVC